MRTIGRRLYTYKGNPNLGTAMFHVLESGKLLDRVMFLEVPEPNPDVWHHAETVNDRARYIFMLKWSSLQWGEECIALFDCPKDGREWAARAKLGRHEERIVRLVEPITAALTDFSRAPTGPANG